MSSKLEKDKQKQIQDKCQAVLNAMLRDEDNKYCVDCDSKGPRWASWNLGVFLCIRCAGIHRNLGVHISKVKSVNLDTWTPEQVVSLQQMGNSRARAVYEANLPDNFRRPQSDLSLESFVRAKYESKKYIAREWVPPVVPKVDWEKEIDDEIEKQKRKKKAQSTAVDAKPIKIAEVPQIPKPKTASPKPARTVVEKNTQDLLGLQNGEDGFTGFLSATVPDEVKKEEPADAARAEEESFFNQPAPTEKEKTKLTKDSILALYANAPQPQAFGSFQQPTGGAFPPNYQFQNFGGFPPPPPQGFPAQFPAGQFQQFQYPMQYPAGQFAGQPSQFQAPQYTPQAQYGVVPAQFPPGQGFQQPGASNPFFGNQPGLRQQFSDMSLGTAPNKGPVATNLWQ